MLNRAILIGRLTRDPELRYTGSGVALVRFNVAVDRKFTNQQGERGADFIDITAWRALAENCAKYLQKGSLVGIEGRIQTGKYDNQEGRTVYTTDVVADDVRFLDSRNSKDYKDPNLVTTGVTNNHSDDPFANDSKPLELTDDDLPF